MKRVLTALVLIPVVLLIVFLAPLWVFAAFTCLVAMLALYEYLFIAEQYGARFARVDRQWTYAVVLILFVVTVAADWRNPPRVFAWTVLILAIAPFRALLNGMRRSDLRDVLPTACFMIFAILYLGLSLLTLVWIRATPDGVFWIVVLFATVWAGDAVAMYVGRALGRHKLAPRISPNKTWEGSLGSVAGSVAFSLLAYRYRLPILSADHRLRAAPADIPPAPAIAGFIVIVILLNIAAQCGDLVESLMKRGADIKDSGALLPGHGGMLDRIDALLVAAPVLWIFLALR